MIQTLVEGEKYKFRIEVKDPTGEWKERTKTFYGGKRAAEAEYRRFCVEVETEGRAAVGTVAHVCWIYHDQISRRGRTAYYVEQTEGYCRRICEAIGSVPLKNLTPGAVEDFYSSLGVSPNTIKHYHSFLRPALQVAVDNGWITSNPAVRASRPSVPKPELYVPTFEEVQKLLIAALETEPWDFYVFLSSAIALSARRGEICALRWNDFNWERGTVEIKRSFSKGVVKDTKTHNTRIISLVEGPYTKLLKSHRVWQENTAEAILARLVPNCYLFPLEPDGLEPINPERYTDAFERVRLRAGLKGVRLHDLRHFGATEALAAGMPISMVSYRLGHQKMSTTLDMYGHHRPDLDIHVANFMNDKVLFPHEQIEGDSTS
jgi:integrase